MAEFSVSDLLLKLLLQVFNMVDLEIFIKSQTVDEILVANSSHDRDNFDMITSILNFKIICDK